VQTLSVSSSLRTSIFISATLVAPFNRVE